MTIIQTDMWRYSVTFFYLLTIFLTCFVAFFGCDMEKDYRLQMSRNEWESIELDNKEEWLISNYEEILLNPIWDRINLLNSEKKVFSQLTPGQKALYSLYELRAQVDNGGIAQYFFNPHGRFRYDALESLKLINFPELYNRLEDMIDIFEKNEDEFIDLYIEDEIAAEKLLKSEKFDNFFYDHINILQRKMYQYLIEHPNDFVVFNDS